MACLFYYCLAVMYVISIEGFYRFCSFDEDLMKSYSHDLVVYITFPVVKGRGALIVTLSSVFISLLVLSLIYDF